MRYKYLAYNAAGEKAAGVVEADSSDRAEEILWRSNLTVTRLSREMAMPTLEEAIPTLFGVKRQDLVIFSRDLASLIGAGIPLLLALRMLKDQAKKASLRRVMGEIIVSLEAGNSFSQACAQHSTVFPPLFLRLIEIGEEIGSLDMVLRQITTHYEKELALQSRIRSALTYPILVLLLAIASIFILVNFVMPAIMGLFTEFKAELPVATRILLAASAFLKAYGLLIILGLVITAVLAYFYIRTPAGNRRKDYFIASLPVIGELSRKGNIGRIARTMVILLKAGVPLTEALNLMVQTTENKAFKEGLVAVDGEVRRGRLLSQAFTAHPLFTPMLVQMTAVGEQTGRLESNLETLSGYYEQEADRLLTRLTELIEPILIVSVGGLVGFIAISVITPMYGIIQEIE